VIDSRPCVLLTGGVRREHNGGFIQGPVLAWQVEKAILGRRGEVDTRAVENNVRRFEVFTIMG
jgi:hypothetical protein